MWSLRLFSKTVVSASFGVVSFAMVKALWAADAPSQSVVNETIVASLQSVIKIFGSNAWMQGLVAILVTFTVASLTTWVLFKLLRRVTARTKFSADDQIVVLLRPPIYYTLLVSGISYGLRVMPLADSVEAMTTRGIESLGVVVWIIFFTRLASSLDFELRCWVPRPELCGQIIDALNTAVYKEFTRLGIEIPYAKQDLYIKGLPESLGALVAGKQSVVSAEQQIISKK